MATDSSQNLILYYDWATSTTDIWTLNSHDTLHTFAHITGVNTGPGLPITGFYAGATTGNVCTFGQAVGHVSKIETDATSCLTESSSSIPSTTMLSFSGNGHGVHCKEFKTSVIEGFVSGVATYSTETIALVDACSLNTLSNQ